MSDGPVAVLRRKLREVFAAFRPEGALFSGGLDSAAAGALTGCRKGIVVTLGEDAPDLKYARQAADALQMELRHVVISRRQAIEALPEVIRLLKTLDPAIPNDLAVYFGLKEAQSMGLRSVVTGDGSDELLGGYSYMQSIADLNGYIRDLSRVMSFNSGPLGRHFGIVVMQPFLHPGVVEHALAIGQEWKVREVNGVIQGKWVLREALKGTLPEAILWQDKRPLEAGSGMTLLNSFFDTCISDGELIDRKQRYGIDFMNKAQSYYCEIYKQVVGDIPRPGHDERPCGACGAGVKENGNHCRVCGWVDEVLR